MSQPVMRIVFISVIGDYIAIDIYVDELNSISGMNVFCRVVGVGEYPRPACKARSRTLRRFLGGRHPARGRQKE